MNRILLIAKREYLSTIRRKGFIIVTFGMPVFLALIYGVAGGAAFLATKQSRTTISRMGIVDEAGILRFELLERVQASSEETKAPPDFIPLKYRDQFKTEMKKVATKYELVPYRTRSEALNAYLQQKVRGFYIIPAEFLKTGTIQLEIKKGAFMSDNSPGWSAVRRLAAASLVEGRLEKSVAERAWIPAVLETQSLNDEGKPDQRSQYSEITGFALPYAFAFFFILAVMSSAGYLMQGVSEEKENRVIEILISSVTPDQLLAGKILGLGAAGLSQVGIWILMGAIPASQALPFLDLRWDQLLAALIYFPLGFLLYGSLMGGSAALGNNFRESQQASMIWTFSAIIPFFVMTAIVSQPNGTVARALSYFPLTAPMTMMMRVGAGKVPWWDMGLSILLLLLGLALLIRLGARLFRIGTLMYGKKPSLVEIVRWVKNA